MPSWTLQPTRVHAARGRKRVRGAKNPTSLPEILLMEETLHQLIVIPLFTGFFTCEMVVWDLWTINCMVRYLLSNAPAGLQSQQSKSHSPHVFYHARLFLWGSGKADLDLLQDEGCGKTPTAACAANLLCSMFHFGRSWKHILQAGDVWWKIQVEATKAPHSPRRATPT